jgi:hypothetical protein
LEKNGKTLETPEIEQKTHVHSDHDDYVVLQPRHAFGLSAHFTRYPSPKWWPCKTEKQKGGFPPYIHLVPSCDFAQPTKDQANSGGCKNQTQQEKRKENAVASNAELG